MFFSTNVVARVRPLGFVLVLLAGAVAGSPHAAAANATAHSFSVIGPSWLLPSGGAHGRDKIIHDFGSGTDGSAPRSELIADSSGNLYGTTTSQGGGCSTCGMVFRLTPSGSTYVESNLYGFLGPPRDGFEPFAGLVADSKGNLYGTTIGGGHGKCSNGCGTVFELTNYGSGHYVERLVYEFKGGRDGSNPRGALIFDPSGDLFGTTLNGGKGCGTSGCGTVYEIKPSGSAYTEQVIYRFPPQTPSGGGGHPYGSLVLDQRGYLYGTASTGGTAACACGEVYQLKPAQPQYKETTLYSFASSPDGSTPVAGLVSDANGNLYGTTEYGGSASCGCGTVFKIVLINGHYFENVVHSFSGPDGALPEAPVIVDQNGVLYGTANSGGRPGKGTVFALTPSGSTYTGQVAYSFSGANNDGQDPFGGVLLENGLLYGTTYVGGTLSLGTAYAVPTPTPGPLSVPRLPSRSQAHATNAALSPCALVAGPVCALQSYLGANAPAERQMTLEQELARGVVSAGCSPNTGGPCPPFYVLNDLSRAVKSTCDKNIPNGYAPCDLYDAYNLSNYVNNPGGTIAIVLAYRQPYIVSDAAAYRQAAQLPKCNPSNGDGCVYELNEYGQSSPLPEIDPNGQWALEWSLDVDMVSAICPSCKIVLFEGKSIQVVDFATAENSAAALPGVIAINNSYNLGSSEITTKSVVNAYFHPGIAITVAAGDHGYHVDSPADYRTVTAVGGTKLTRKAGGTGRKWSETVWNTGARGATGGGCSAVIAAQKWQTDIEKAENLQGCSQRVVSDVAFDGDPTTGVAVYCSFKIQNSNKNCQGPTKPWLVVGGTSAGAPAIAAIYGLSGPSVLEIPAELAYMSPWPNNFYDITSGSNGSCSIFWLCNAQTGYDAPTGVGSPNGIDGF